MQLRTTYALFALLIFLFTFSTSDGLSEAKTSKNDPKTTTTKAKWARVDGFRSAKFGMNEKKVMRAIVKDFKISKSKVKRNVHPTEKTVNISVTVPKLMAAGGTANVVYIFGQKSRRLMQVNILWGRGVTKNADGEDMVTAANLLRDHFMKKKYKKDSLAANAKLNDTQIIVFRGRDEKNRMILLVMTTPKGKKGENAKEAAKKISLKLSYMLDVDKPDVLSIKEGEF